MVTASVTGFLRIILFIAIFYLLLKWLGKLFMPWLAKKAKSTMSQRMQEEMKKRQESNKPPRQEGEVTIEYSANNKGRNPQKSRNEAGEYVDFEEVD